MPGFVMEKPTYDNEDKTIWPTGAHDFELVDVQLGIYTPRNSQFGTDPRPAARFVYKDADGDRLETDCINLPKGFAYNEKSWFWKHVGALYGRSIRADDTVSIEASVAWERWDEWDRVLPAFFKSGVELAGFKHITVNGVNVLEPGRKVILSLERRTFERNDGTEGEANKVNAVLPKTAEEGKGKKKSKAQAQEQEDDLDLPY